MSVPKWMLIALVSCALNVQQVRSEDPARTINSAQDWRRVLAEENTVNYPIVFVHGIGGGFRNWESVASRLSGGSALRIRFDRNGKLWHDAEGVVPKANSVWIVSYYSDRPVRESLTGNLSRYAERLREIVSVVQELTGQDKVVLVCHSMGGLVGRAYMSLDESCWESVHKIVTVATPHEGVKTSIGVVGQLKDLRKKSRFLVRLNEHWLEQIEKGFHGWGVVGALDTKANQSPDVTRAGSMTDSGGIGFVELSSAIPFGEWQGAVGDRFEMPTLQTKHFGYRVAIRGRHNDILDSAATDRVIEWALKP